ncbi:MAG TPA: LysM domain-containing protein [Solirubrobacterales bacterium]|jgi:LysM repeat protein|nr:LysM domain-containing protein [Solirubrobacterales bacterium]
MPERKPNQVARVLAVLGLLAAFGAVIVMVATSDGSDDGNGDDGDRDKNAKTGPTKKGERAIERGVWVVGDGDTLVSISEETGIDLDELVALNPEIDPQSLSPGQRISLREGAIDGDGSSADGGTTTNEDTITEGSGIGDEGPTGTGTTETSDSFSTN